MSLEQEVTTILEGRVPDTSENGASIIALARVEVSKFLEISIAYLVPKHRACLDKGCPGRSLPPAQQLHEDIYFG